MAKKAKKRKTAKKNKRRVWVDAEKRLPRLKETSFMSSGTFSMEFKVDGKVYEGHYHTNGCFYTDGRVPSFAAHTKLTVEKYPAGNYPKARVTHWRWSK